MKATVRDPEVLRAVSPIDLAEYLQAKNWRVERGALVDSWLSPEAEGRAEVLLPNNSSVIDYAIRVAQVLEVLEHFEGRSQLEVLRDINRVGLDVVRLRTPEVDEKLNSISLRRGARLVDHAMEMMAAAAAAAVEPRKVIPSRRPRMATSYMENVELGQSEKGSYVLTILSRVEADTIADAPGLLELMDVPYPRQVTRNLSTALGATVSAIRSSDGFGAAKRVRDAVSSRRRSKPTDISAQSSSVQTSNPRDGRSVRSTFRISSCATRRRTPQTTTCINCIDVSGCVALSHPQ